MAHARYGRALCTACGPWRASRRCSTPPLRARPPSTACPGGPGSSSSSRTCSCSRRASSRTCAPPGPTPRATRCSQPWSHGQKSDFLDRSAPLGVTRGQDCDFLDQLQSHSTLYDRETSVLPALFSPPLSARGQNRSRKSSFCPQGASQTRIGRESRDPFPAPPSARRPPPRRLAPPSPSHMPTKSPRRREGFHSAPNLRGPNGETPAVEGFSAIGTSVSVGARTRQFTPGRAA